MKNPVAPLVVVGLLLLGAAKSQAADAELVAKAASLLEARCCKCHGAEKGAAELRLHSAEALAKAEEDGALVKGDAESSEIYNRLLYPKGHKKLMPKGAEPFTAEEQQVIADWINAGAEFVTAEKPAPAPAPAPEAKPEMKKEELSPAAAGEAPAPAAATAIEEVTKLGGVVTPLFAESPLLTVCFPTTHGEIGDAEVDKIAALAPQLVSLHLGHSKVTDAGVAKLSACANLERLHLEGTAVTDASVKSLAGLTRLSYLNLYGTKISDESLLTVQSGLPGLKSLFLWQCKVSYEKAQELMKARPQLEVNLGWDHPGVLKERLTKELERLTSELEAKKTTVTTAEQQLTDAKQALQALEDQAADAKKQLEALGK